MACQVFHSGLTQQESLDIEAIQKKSLQIILGDQYGGYEEACTLLSAEPRYDRRQTLCLTFVKRSNNVGFRHFYSSEKTISLMVANR